MSAIPFKQLRERWRAPRLPAAARPLDYPHFWRIRPGLVTALFLAYLVVHGLMILGSEALALGDPRRFTWLPPMGLMFSVLLITPRRTWLVWLVSAVSAEMLVRTFLIDLPVQGEPPAVSALRVLAPLLTVVFVGDMLIGAVKLRRPLYFYTIVSLGAAVAALLVGLLLNILNSAGSGAVSWLSEWWRGTLAIYLGIVVVGPLVMSWTFAARRSFSLSRWRFVEIGLLALCVLACLAVALFYEPDATFWRFGDAALVFWGLLLVTCSWAALRFDFRVMSAIVAIYAVVVTLTATTGHGMLVTTLDEVENAQFKVQTFVLILAQLVFLLNVAALEAVRAREELRTHESIEGVVMRLSTRFVDARPEQLNRLIESSLGEIGALIEADRCALWTIDRARDEFRESHVALVAGDAGMTDEPRRGRLSDHPWALGQLERAGGFVLVEPGKGLPAEAAEFSAVWPEETGAVAVTALMFDGRLVGALGFEWSKSEFDWSDDIVALVRIFGQLFANMLRRRNSEQELIAYQRKLRMMARELSLSEERARRRTATDLHDGIGQNLAVAKIKLGQLRASATSDTQSIDMLLELIEDTLKQSRFIIADLSPSILYDFGLVAAVRWLAGRTESRYDGLGISVEETGSPWDLSEDGRVAIFRAVRELLQNANKHAQATRISVHIDWRADDVHVCVSDNGVGFESLEVADATFDIEPDGFGLFSVRESVNALGGELSVESQPGDGAAISFTINRLLAQT